VNELLRKFILLFAVIDPIGTIPVFLAVTKSFDKTIRFKVALRACVAAGCILLFFIVAGQVLIEHMGISLAAFQVAGGLILLIFALTMIFGKEAHSDGKEISDYQHVAIFPMAIPAIATPGAILAVILLTDNNVYDIGQQVVVAITMLVVIIITFFLLLSANGIQKVIGVTGITVITKIMGLLLCGIATESMLAGVKTYFKI